MQEWYKQLLVTSIQDLFSILATQKDIQVLQYLGRCHDPRNVLSLARCESTSLPIIADAIIRNIFSVCRGDGAYEIWQTSIAANDKALLSDVIFTDAQSYNTKSLTGLDVHEISRYLARSFSNPDHCTYG